MKVTDENSRIRIRIHLSEVQIDESGSVSKCHGSAKLVAWRARRTILFDVPARQATYRRQAESTSGLLHPFQIRKGDPRIRGSWPVPLQTTTDPETCNFFTIVQAYAENLLGQPMTSVSTEHSFPKMLAIFWSQENEFCPCFYHYLPKDN